MGSWSCSVYGSCPGNAPTCTTNLTVWNPANLNEVNIRDSKFYRDIRTAVNREQRRRSISQTSFPNDLSTNTIDKFKYVTELKTAMDSIVRSKPGQIGSYTGGRPPVCDTNTVSPTIRFTLEPSLTWLETYVNSTSITSVRKQLIELRKNMNKLENQCMCNCNHCTCHCNYCTCNCNYCVCDCAYDCVCNCAYHWYIDKENYIINKKE